LQKEKISVEKMLIVVDDIALPFGTIRIKTKGGSGGHNGLQNIQEVIGNSNYNRLRFGIGNEFYQGGQTNYVLGEWSEHEKENLNTRIKVASEAILQFSCIGIERTMNFYNNK
ncbi:MAG: aminoacyl-tRNA hydrolase, partial [Bacteroidales bacterium]|nr:aminoacyl-tRNA hydrolase [Bacteroidales bacterium]